MSTQHLPKLSTVAATAGSSYPTPPPDGDGHFDSHATRTPTGMPASGGIVSSCPDCGSDVAHPYLKQLQDAQLRIEELEQQIGVLTLRAATAMEKATEYETSLKRMNSLSSAGRSSTPEPSSAANDAQSTPGSRVTSPERTPSRGLARLLPTRMPSLRSATSSPALNSSTSSPQSSTPSRSTPVPTPLVESTLPPERPSAFPMLSHTPPTPLASAYPPPANPPGAAQEPRPETTALLTQLTQEQERRRAAEAEASKTKSEIEELTGQLFEQANEMVATERKARAKLEARVEILEKRDGEKTRRLTMLETRVQRVERVRGLLSEKVVPSKEAIVATSTSRERGGPSPVQQVGVRA